MKSASAYLKAALSPFRTERALHICVLCAFTFSEPLLFALSQQLAFLHDLDFGWSEVAYVLVVLSIGVPVFWILLDQLAIRISGYWNHRGRNVVLGFLFCLFWLTLVRPFMRFQILEVRTVLWLGCLGIAVPAAILSLRLYLNRQWVRFWMTAAALGIVCVPALFIYRYVTLTKVKPHPTTVNVEHPVPVIMIVFDEFSGTSLMNRDLEIDAKQFPQFGRLAQMSTWYRQASTVHSRTNKAVPAILSGRYPTDAETELESPGNLFQLIHGTNAFDMTVYEPITRLCPKGVLRRVRVVRTPARKIAILNTTLLALYPHLILPRDTPLDFPPISRLWFGFEESDDDFRQLYAQNINGLRRFFPFVQRDEQLRRFINSISDTSKPPFQFMHVELPHVPWSFLPTGRQYNYDEIESFRPAGSWGDLGEDWGADPGPVIRNEFRYLQQIGYLDRFIGQLLDRLDETQLLDRCLLIVTADHGIAFRPGHSRRIPDNDTLPEMISVPLFIKLPGQREGITSDSNVESVDILPTIAEVLGLSLTEPVDGIPASSITRAPRKMLYFENGGKTTLEPAIPGLAKAVSRRWDIFSSGSLGQLPSKACTHPNWTGRSTSEFSIFSQPLQSLKIERPERTIEAGACEFVPALVWGSLDTHELQRPAGDLVLAIDGVIVDSGSTFVRGHTIHGFEFLLPESIAREQGHQVELFHVAEEGQPARLRLLKKWTLGRNP